MNSHAHREIGSPPRRGVASVLAMMFLVVFGSLAAVMAVVAQSNLRTADSYLKVTRATSEAEKGLIFARRRLHEQAHRFVVTKGVVDSEFGTKLWLGTYGPSDGTVEVLDAVGFVESPKATSIAVALLNSHNNDLHNIEVHAADALLPSIDEFGTLRTKPIGTIVDGLAMPHFRLKYELLADGRFVRVTSQGVDGDVTRTLTMDFRINKRIKYAVISPNRIMIGKNVRIEGPLGTRYGIMPGELEPQHGNPLLMKSDFYHLDPALDARLDVFFEKVQEFDVDGDTRLRVNHPAESQALTEPYLVDYIGDGYVTDFDLFMAFFDQNGDGMVVYDADLAAAAGYGSASVEFDRDDQMARLIDFANPDRNDDGEIDAIDLALGYGDGIIDARDYYAKVDGKLMFAVSKNAWEAARGASYQKFVHGPIRPGVDEAAVTFEVEENDLLDIQTADFANASNWFKDQALSGAGFWDQVAASSGTYTAAADAPWEPVPYGAKGYYDWYQRPIFEDMTFRDVTIPEGVNGLFINCTFIGVTYVRTYTQNEDVNWNYVGMVDRNLSTGEMEPKYPGLEADMGGDMVSDTRPYSNNIRFHSCTFAGSVVSDTPLQYTHVRNKIQFTGAIRFTLDHPELTAPQIEELQKSSIFMPGYSVDVGDFLNSNVETTELRGTIIAGILDARGTVDIHGTLLMTYRPVVGEGPLFYGGTPDGFNTTIGYFGPADGDEESVDPSTLVDNPNPGYPDMPGVPQYDGLPDIGIDLTGDGINEPFMGFGHITLRYDPDAKLPDGIPWPVSIEPEPGTYSEGGEL